MHHIFFPPRFQAVMEEHPADRLIGDLREVVMRREELLPERAKCPMGVSCRWRRAARGGHERLMVRLNRRWLPGSGRIGDGLLDRGAFAEPPPHRPHHVRGATETVRDVPVCCSVVGEKKNPRAGERTSRMRSVRDGTPQKAAFPFLETDDVRFHVGIREK